MKKNLSDFLIASACALALFLIFTVYHADALSSTRNIIGAVFSATNANSVTDASKKAATLQPFEGGNNYANAMLRLDQFYNRLTRENASVLFIGDSTASPANQDRWPQSIIRKWDVPWVGFVTLSCSSNSENYTAYTACTNTVASGAAWTDGSGTNDTIFRGVEVNGGTGGNNLMDMNLVGLNNYLRGNWTHNKNLSANTIVHKANNQFTSNVVQEFWRGQNGSFNGVSFGPVNVAATSALQGISLPFASPIPAQIPQDTVRARLTTYSGNPGKVFHLLATEFYSPGATGFSLFPIGVPGSNSRNWMHKESDSLGFFTQAQIRNSLGLVQRKVNTIIIQLGINGTTGEGDDTDTSEAIYKARIATVVDQWKADAEAAGAKDVKVLLINPWRSSLEGSPNWVVRRGRANMQIAQERPFVSYINLDTLLKETYGPNWASLYLADGVHQNTAGVLAIGDITWKAISGQLNTPNNAPTNVGGGIQDIR